MTGCISILQLSDLHILAAPDDKILGINTGHYFHACLLQAMQLRWQQAATKKHFDLVLLTGDLAQEPCPASYQRILTQLETYRTPCVCLPGNHDDMGLMQQILATQWVNCQKRTVLDHWQLLCLNSKKVGETSGYLSKDELQFLDGSLYQNPGNPTLIAVHHHCVATHSPWMDTMIIENSQELWDVVGKYPQVKAITMGHIHQTMDIKVSGVRVLGVPSTCYQFAPGSSEFCVDNAAPGYRLIELYADGRIETEVVRLQEPLVGLELASHGY